MSESEEVDHGIEYARGETGSSDSSPEPERIFRHIPHSGGENCPICVEQVLSTDVRLPCSHVYHMNCLKDMLMRHGTDCSLCRAELSFGWLYENRVVTRVSPRLYWRRVRYGFGRWPEVGPFVPCQQRYYDYHYYGETMPVRWSRQWIADRKAELRMRLNIPPSVFFSNNLLLRCMERGRHGLIEWIPRMSV